MLKKIIPSALVLSSFAFASATIISGQNQSVTFNSKPEGATVLVDGVYTCTTPCTISLPKSSKDKTVTFKKDGFQTVNLPVTHQYDGVALLNIFWDISTTDMITGAAWKYEPNNYFVEMKKD